MKRVLGSCIVLFAFAVATVPGRQVQALQPATAAGHPAGVAAEAVAGQSREIPVDTVIEVRIRQLISSYGSEAYTPVTFEVIAPVRVDGRIVLPMGSLIFAYVDETRRVGIGFSREVAFIDLRFVALELPGGETTPIGAVVAGVDNSRESVDENGRILGIRASGSVSSTISGMALSVGFFDPILLGYTASTALSAFRIPESEIVLPPGAEMKLRLTAPLPANVAYDYPVPLEITDSEAERSALETLIRGLPFRTTTPDDGQPSDVTNLLFLGEEAALTTAFVAAGWAETDSLSGESVYGVMRSVVENQGYQEAPMSTLLLDGATPAHTFAKTLDTFFSRHHLRIFGRPETFDERTVWTSSSTQDIGVGIATNSKTFIHLIDEHIDHERDKVVNDLVITGCIDAVQYVERPWVPRDASNATGDQLLTDGRIAVLALNECASPNLATAPLEEAREVVARPGAATRFFRDFVLLFKNSMFRGNIFYQGYWATKLGINALSGSDDGEGPRVVEFGGQSWEIVPGPEADNYEDHVKDPIHTRPTFEPIDQQRDAVGNYATRLEFSAGGGYMRFGNDQFSTLETSLVVSPEEGVEVGVPVGLVSEYSPGWNFAFNTTLNAHRHFSHEFGYTFNSGDLDIILDFPDELIPGLDETINGPSNVRQFSYNLLVHARPNGKRFRPYAAVGPVLQMIRVSEPLSTSRGIFRFAFKEVGIIVGAWNFGSTPPLEGGGIFQPGLQYGGGVKIYLTEHLVLRADFRETLSAQPDIWKGSTDRLEELPLEDVRLEVGDFVKHGMLRHQRFSLGLGFAF